MVEVDNKIAALVVSQIVHKAFVDFAAVRFKIKIVAHFIVVRGFCLRLVTLDDLRLFWLLDFQSRPSAFRLEKLHLLG